MYSYLFSIFIAPSIAIYDMSCSIPYLWRMPNRRSLFDTLPFINFNGDTISAIYSIKTAHLDGATVVAEPIIQPNHETEMIMRSHQI